MFNFLVGIIFVEWNYWLVFRIIEIKIKNGLFKKFIYLYMIGKKILKGVGYEIMYWIIYLKIIKNLVCYCCDYIKNLNYFEFV